MERQPELRREIRDEYGIARGSRSPESVIEVQNAKWQTELLKYVEEANGIRAAGHGDSNGAAAVQHPIAFESASDAVHHVPIIAW